MPTLHLFYTFILYSVYYFYLQCKYKPDCEELELAYALDTNLNYDQAYGKELAVETDKSSKDKSSYPRLRYNFIIPNT